MAYVAAGLISQFFDLQKLKNFRSHVVNQSGLFYQSKAGIGLN